MATILERLNARTTRTETGCWLWTGSRDKGYGTIKIGGRSGKTRSVHRIAYELLKGPIPDGLDLDHDCHNRDLSCPGGETCEHRACWNPAHLLIATRGENLRRGRGHGSETHCSNGHEFTPENTGTRSRKEGGRYCRACARDAVRERRARAAAAATHRH